jgi:hypothetical protein
LVSMFDRGFRLSHVKWNFTKQQKVGKYSQRENVILKTSEIHVPIGIQELVRRGLSWDSISLLIGWQ